MSHLRDAQLAAVLNLIAGRGCSKTRHWLRRRPPGLLAVSPTINGKHWVLIASSDWIWTQPNLFFSLLYIGSWVGGCMFFKPPPSSYIAVGNTQSTPKTMRLNYWASGWMIPSPASLFPNLPKQGCKDKTKVNICLQGKYFHLFFSFQLQANCCCFWISQL